MTIHVAVGVIVNRENEILIARRPEHLHQGGLWEFPGGKVESNETLPQALKRELWEELGLVMEGCRPLIEVHHNYADKSVFLDVWWVEEFSGIPTGREGQPIQWVAVDKLTEYTFPEANQQIVQAVQYQMEQMP